MVSLQHGAAWPLSAYVEVTLHHSVLLIILNTLAQVVHGFYFFTTTHLGLDVDQVHLPNQVCTVCPLCTFTFLTFLSTSSCRFATDFVDSVKVTSGSTLTWCHTLTK